MFGLFIQEVMSTYGCSMRKALARVHDAGAGDAGASRLHVVAMRLHFLGAIDDEGDLTDIGARAKIEVK